MQAIILTAGYGRRMQPLSSACHKALLPIAGTTILGRIVDSLIDVGVHDIVIVTGYRADDVRAFLEARYPSVPFSFVHNERYADTNNIVSLSLALDRLKYERDVLLIECDLLFDTDLLRRLVRAPGGNTALVDHFRSGMDGTVVAVEDGVITHVYPPHLQGSDFTYADKFKTLNIYRFDRDFCRSTLQPLLSCYANFIDGNCYYELVLGMLVNMQRQRIAAEVVDGSYWAEVDDPNDLAVARYHFEPAARASVLDRACGGHWNFELLDFAFMRNAYFPTDAMLAAFRQALPALLRSYGSSQVVLNEKLSYFLGCAPDRLQVLHGASQVFPWLPELLGDGPVLVPSPTFGEYARAFPNACKYADAPGIDLERLEREAPRSGVVVFVNPNNPTGTVTPSAWLHRYAASHPGLRVFIDESFIDFSGERSIVELLEREPLANVVVLTSLSKTLGVPGLRLGYVYSSDRAFLDAVGQRMPVWNLGAPAEFLIELLLKFRTELASSVTQTIADRTWLSDAVAAIPLVEKVFPSGGNFLLARLAGGDAALAGRVRRNLLAKASIDLKDVSAKFGDGRPYLRFAVRLPHENARFVDALGEAVQASVQPALGA
jgi:histidinol-phosphate/aromatic aminotransferase/cobyric acid decarboxylase-like protein/choline kinase